ncbi:MAG: hypothetical protein COB17_00430 [Sulfurimonas sp.]|nr:MAG: hypothetical protein COB17_00430 [Sulfurimonas sp.]
MIFVQKKTIVSLLLSTSILTSTLSAQSSQDIVSSIMKLRGDVESLYTGIKENEFRYKTEMKSLSMQATDLEAQINRQSTSLKLAKSELNKIKAKIKETVSSNDDIKPMVLDALNLLSKSIKEGIPFMVEDRVASLNKIKADMNEGLITSEKALSLAWASYDDTLRITKEIGLFKQKITINGKVVLSKIAKIGSVMMFFSTPNNKLGYVVKKNNAYEYKLITDPKDIKKISSLFDALQKQIKTGFFEIPNALVLQGSK